MTTIRAVAAVLLVAAGILGDRPSAQTPPADASRGFVVSSLALLSAQAGPPEDLRWDAKLKADVTEAMAFAARDPVNGLYVLQGLQVRQQKPKLNDRQKAWLLQHRHSTEPAALEALRRQFDEAATRLDIRTLWIIDGVARELIPNQLGRTDILESVRRRILSEDVQGQALRVADAAGSLLPAEYREGANVFNQYVITPKSGFKILSVKGTVSNTSGSADSPLVPRFLGEAKMLASSLSGGFSTAGAHDPMFRYVDSSFVFLVDAGGQLTPCVYVPERPGGSSLTLQLRGGGGTKLSAPAKLKQGESSAFEFIFSVPADAGPGFRLWMAGASPVPIALR